MQRKKTARIPVKDVSRRDRRLGFEEGARDAVPIALGYFAVAFSLGIEAHNIGLNALQGFLMSLLGNASAGQYAAMTVIAADASYLQMVLITLVANARYMLMSVALSQRFAPGTPLRHRLLVGYDITDELFGIAISRPYPHNPYYSYGSYVVAMPGWALGTAAGIIAGNVLPLRLVSALSVALFGMFLAVIIPPARRDKVVAGCVIVSFAASFAAKYLPVLRDLSAGTKTIVLTLIIAGIAAALFPVKEEQQA